MCHQHHHYLKFTLPGPQLPHCGSPDFCQSTPRLIGTQELSPWSHLWFFSRTPQVRSHSSLQKCLGCSPIPSSPLSLCFSLPLPQAQNISTHPYLLSPVTSPSSHSSLKLRIQTVECQVWCDLMVSVSGILKLNASRAQAGNIRLGEWAVFPSSVLGGLLTDTVFEIKPSNNLHLHNALSNLF